MYCTHTSIQDGVTADDVAEVHGHQAVCDELRKNAPVGRKPLGQVRHNNWGEREWDLSSVVAMLLDKMYICIRWLAQAHV